ncbi:MAG: HTH domain-containing protein, partial [Oligosphaeraceae bacterium]
ATQEGEQKAAGEQKKSPKGEQKKEAVGARKEQLSVAARILQLMKEQPTISRRALAAQLARSETAIYKQLCKLRQQGKIRRVGPDKGGHWEVLE